MAIPGNFLSAVTEQVDPDASGWDATLNCTTSRGTGGWTGSGYLALTAAGAGEMRAETAAAYPVAVGTVYQAFADAATADQPERIGILWLDAAYETVSTTWSLTTSAASSSWHRVSVAGVAPAGAVYARVVLSATASAASKVSYFDTVYLGAPKRTSGNLLGFNSESCGDLDGTAWAADANCTTGRDAPPVSWPADFYLAGGEVVKAAATADGDMAAVCAETPPVVPGTDYLAYVYLSPPAAGTTAAYVGLRWLDEDGAQVGSVQADLDVTGTGWYQQRVSGVAPATAAAVALVIGVEDATAGQVLRADGAVIIPAAVAPAVVPGTVMPYADYDFEQGVGQWTVDSGVATIARSSPWGAAGHDGAYALAITSSTASASVIASGLYPVAEGLSWRAALHFKAATGTWQIIPQLRFYDADETSISVSDLDADTVTPAGLWWLDWSDVTAPSGAVSARIEFHITAPSAGAVAYIDAVTLTQTQPAFSATADDAHALVRLVMRELDVGDLLTVYRVVGGVQSVVRGPDGPLRGVAITAAQMVVEDAEAPLGVPVSYRYEEYTTDGDFGGTVPAGPVTLAVTDPSTCWIKDPLQPQRNVMVRAATAPDWQRPIEQAEYRIRGRRNSVILSDVRAGLTGTLEVWTRTDDERQALHFALGAGAALLIQLAPGLGLEDGYYAVGTAVEPRLVPYGGEPLRRWQLPLTQVDAPIGGVGGTAGWTVQDVVSTYATVQDVLSAYATVLDLVLDNRET